MDPHRALQEVYVIYQDQKVRRLIQEKSVPRLCNVAGIKEGRHADDLLRDDDGNARAGSDPSEDISRAAAVAL